MRRQKPRHDGPINEAVAGEYERVSSVLTIAERFDGNEFGDLGDQTFPLTGAEWLYTFAAHFLSRKGFFL